MVILNYLCSEGLIWFRPLKGLNQKRKTRIMYTKAAVLKTVRIMHLYLGVFLAPAILFFSFTGALQTFSLHESVKGSGYKPANWIMVLGQPHKKQTAQLPPRKTQPSASSLADARSTSQEINSPAQV